MRYTLNYNETYDNNIVKYGYRGVTRMEQQ